MRRFVAATAASVIVIAFAVFVGMPKDMRLVLGIIASTGVYCAIGSARKPHD